MDGEADVHVNIRDISATSIEANTGGNSSWKYGDCNKIGEFGGMIQCVSIDGLHRRI